MLRGMRGKSRVISTASVSPVKEKKKEREEKINSMSDTTTKQPPFVSAPLCATEIALGTVTFLLV